MENYYKKVEQAGEKLREAKSIVDMRMSQRIRSRFTPAYVMDVPLEQLQNELFEWYIESLKIEKEVMSKISHEKAPQQIPVQYPIADYNQNNQN